VHDLRVIAADGTGDRELCPGGLPGGCAQLGRPGWSPDGELLAVQCLGAGELRSILLTRLDGEVVRTVDEGELSDPAFTKDGASILYWKRPDPDRNENAIYRATVDGSAPPVAITEVGNVNDPAPAPDADRFVFRRIGADGGLWTASLPDGGDERRLSKNQLDHDPTWSPDGRQIAFMRNEQLWIMNADGSGERQLAADEVPITAPAWTTR
jgi:Tol biopolymer transport system component